MFSAFSPPQSSYRPARTSTRHPKLQIASPAVYSTSSFVVRFYSRHHKAICPITKLSPGFILRRVTGEQRQSNRLKLTFYSKPCLAARQLRRQQKLIITPAAIGS